MSHRIIGQEDLFRVPVPKNDLDALSSLLDWSSIEALLSDIYNSRIGQCSWPPLSLFKAQLLGMWYDLSDVKLAEALEDRFSFRRFCGFSTCEATPERTAFVRFRKVLIEEGLIDILFQTITDQLNKNHIEVKTGTMIDATIIESHSRSDPEARYVKHRGKVPRYGYKAHVTADADTALIKTVSTSTANVNDGKAGCCIIPDNPGDVFADSAYRGKAFKDAVTGKGGKARVVCTHVYTRTQEEANKLLAQINAPIHAVRGRIEKIFGTMKRSYGLRHMRWMGYQKAHLQITMTAIAYNMKRGLKCA